MSFQLFHDFVVRNSKTRILHYDMPCTVAGDGGAHRRVRHIATARRLLRCVLQVPLADRVVVFGSRNFCVSYGLILVLASRLFGKLCYVRFFGGHPAQAALLRMPIIRWFFLVFLSLATRLVVQTHIGARAFPAFLRRKTTVVVGYRPPAPELARLDTSRGTIIRFVCTSGLAADKGFQYLLDAFAIVSKKLSDIPVELHFYGAGPAEAVARLRKHSNVTYHGVLTNAELRKALHSYDVFVFPSVYQNEGHPGAIIEALMAGLPVIASDLPGIQEMIQQGANGVLVRPSGVPELANAMQTLARSETMRARLSRGALEAANAFTAGTVVPQLTRAVGIEV